MKYKELASRIKREQELAKAERELEIQRAMGVNVHTVVETLCFGILPLSLIRQREKRRRSALMRMVYQFTSGRQIARNNETMYIHTTAVDTFFYILHQ